MSEEEDVKEARENLREAILGAFYSLAEEDRGLQTHMVAHYVQYYMQADHDPLSVQDQVNIIGIIHQTVLKMLHADPSSLQMAHAHAYVHALVDTYIASGDDSEEEPDTLLEEHNEDLDQWADELAEFMKEGGNSDGEDGTPTEDSGPDSTDDSSGP